MHREPDPTDAAQLSKALGNESGVWQPVEALRNESRLWLLRLIGDVPKTAGPVTMATRMSQALVCPHLRTRRRSSLVLASRSGKEASYELANMCVSHNIADADVLPDASFDATHDATPACIYPTHTT